MNITAAPQTLSQAGHTPGHPTTLTQRGQGFTHGARALLLAAVALLAQRSQAQQPPKWVTMPDTQFAQQYAKQAISPNLTDQSTVAWMLFARVNQPKTYPGNKKKYSQWELWPSNEDTFSPAVRAFVAANKVRTRPHLQPPKLHSFGARVQGITDPFPPTGGGEEVTRNLISYGYITKNKLNTAQGAWQRVSTGPNLDFPIGVVEIKADWNVGATNGAYQVTDTTQNPPVTYSLLGLHIMAKVAPTPGNPFSSEDPSWFWTTFEFRGNPGLANAQSLLTYKDALSRAQSLSLLDQAGLGSGLFRNYFCNGTQIRYSDAKNPAIRLGNTTMEAFAGVPKGGPAQWTQWNASCHTCHGTASANGVSGQSLSFNQYFFTHLTSTMGPIPQSAVSGYTAFDFVWSIPFQAR